jgi:hypothetical protein
MTTMMMTTTTTMTTKMNMTETILDDHVFTLCGVAKEAQGSLSFVLFFSPRSVSLTPRNNIFHLSFGERDMLWFFTHTIHLFNHITKFLALKFFYLHFEGGGRGRLNGSR